MWNTSCGTQTEAETNLAETASGTGKENILQTDPTFFLFNEMLVSSREDDPKDEAGGGEPRFDL